MSHSSNARSYSRLSARIRAYRSCASARCGCRSSPVRATRCAISSCPLRRNSSPRRRNTRLSGSCAKSAESVLISSAMAPRPRAGEGLRRRPRALHVLAARELGLRARGEPFPMVPLLKRFAEATGGDERIAEHPVRQGAQGIEPEGAPQLLHGVGGAPRRERDAAEPQVHDRIVRLHACRLLRHAPRLFHVLAGEPALPPGDEFRDIARARRPPPPRPPATRHPAPPLPP